MLLISDKNANTSFRICEDGTEPFYLSFSFRFCRLDENGPHYGCVQRWLAEKGEEKGVYDNDDPMTLVKLGDQQGVKRLVQDHSRAQSENEQLKAQLSRYAEYCEGCDEYFDKRGFKAHVESAHGKVLVGPGRGDAGRDGVSEPE